MGESSYEKVYKLLEATREGRELVATVGRRIASLKVTGVTFSLSRPDAIGQPAIAVARYTVETESGELMKIRVGDFYLEVSSFITMLDTMNIVDANFGVKGRVATYFCRKTIVTGEQSRRGTESFYRWIGNRLEEKFRQERLDAKERIKAQINEMRESRAHVDAEQAFLAECAVRDIKAALAAYKHLGDAMLKQAIQEFLCDDVFEYVDS